MLPPIQQTTYTGFSLLKCPPDIPFAIGDSNSLSIFLNNCYLYAIQQSDNHKNNLLTILTNNDNNNLSYLTNIQNYSTNYQSNIGGTQGIIDTLYTFKRYIDDNNINDYYNDYLGNSNTICSNIKSGLFSGNSIDSRFTNKCS